MPIGFLLERWNDLLTISTFVLTSSLAYYQIRYYRNQTPALELVAVTDAEYRDFDRYTKYEFTIQIKNDGRDPVFIPDAKLMLSDEEIQLYTVEQYESVSPAGGVRVSTSEFRTIQLGTNGFEYVDLSGSGDAVERTDTITGELQLDTSVGEVTEEIRFSRAP